MAKIVNVLAAIIEKEGKFLIAKRKEGNLKGKWEFPGGTLEDNETHEECLKRELDEEFGVQVKVKGYLGKNIHNYSWKRIKLIGYYVEHTSGKFRLTVHSEIRYVNPHEFRNYDLAPADIPLAEKVIKNYTSVSDAHVENVAQEGEMTAKISKSTEGTWPENDIRRAFVAGATWWEFYRGFAMWSSDIKLAEEEAERRYGNEQPKPKLIYLCPDCAAEHELSIGTIYYCYPVREEKS